MMQKINIPFIFLFLLLISCKPKDDGLLMQRMQRWDMALEANPEAVRDSLQSLNPAILTNENKAYYGLLKTISDDKTYAHFTSDALIKETEYYYRIHDASSNLHIRSLIYVSIVRNRIGITDSTTLIPLKEAETIFNNQDNQNPSIGYLLNFFLGSTHSANNNLTISLEYLKKSLQFAKTERNASHIFDSYLALFWNYMKQQEFIKGKEYLDSLEMMEVKNADEKYFLLNAQSSYYYTQQLYEKSIEKEKEQIKLAPFIKEKPEIFRIYYSISTLYQNLNQFDSAEVYSLKAIENIADTSYQLNYLLYENIADIAENKRLYNE